MEEERRLFYVGITRARRRLYITHAARRMAYGNNLPGMPSRFLASLPEGTAVTGRTGVRAGRLSERVRSGFDSNGRSAGFEPDRAIVQSVATVPQIETPVYAAGQRVFHSRFGEGTIVEVIDRSGDQEIVVDFVRNERRRLIASIARDFLDLIE
jgi:DNA helicase-2/ATP-dependent DNA helicase PcrA